MRDVIITPTPLSGSVRVPPSKSAAHRMLLAAALSEGVSRLFPICHSEDIDATLGCIKALGAVVEERDNSFFITGIDKNSLAGKRVTLDCGESGSTLRFIIPIAAALGVNATFIGRGRLPLRPIDEICGILKENGVSCSSNKLPLTISGKLLAGEYKISGNVSSQFLTGLLLALPLVLGRATVTLTTPLESKGYVDMTVAAMGDFGVEVELKNKKIYSVKGSYKKKEGEIEGDWSQACFFMAAAFLGEIEILGLKENTRQGDKAALEVFKRLGAEISFKDNILRVKRDENTLNGSELKTAIDCSQIPDMVPSLAVAAALGNGETTLTGCGRLRIKESDRIKTTLAALKALGVKATELKEGMIIKSGAPTGGSVEGAGDHRIVMAASVLASAAEGKTVIKGSEAINKSYPHFFSDFARLGGIADVITDR